MKTFSDTQPKRDLENDRVPLADGMFIVVTDIVFSDKTKYEMIAKVNGYNAINKQPGKWRTTSKVLVRQLKDAADSIGSDKTGHLKEPFGVQIVKAKGENGTYLTCRDAPA